MLIHTFTADGYSKSASVNGGRGHFEVAGDLGGGSVTLEHCDLGADQNGSARSSGTAADYKTLATLAAAGSTGVNLVAGTLVLHLDGATDPDCRAAFVPDEAAGTVVTPLNTTPA